MGDLLKGTPLIRRAATALATVAVTLLALLTFGADPALAAGPWTFSGFLPCSTGFPPHLCDRVEAYAPAGGTAARIYVQNTGTDYTVDVYDTACDNTDPIWHAHNTTGGYFALSVPGSPTCGHNHLYHVAYNAIGSPKVWWFQMGTQNSGNFTFPS